MNSGVVSPQGMSLTECRTSECRLSRFTLLAQCCLPCMGCDLLQGLIALLTELPRALEVLAFPLPCTVLVPGISCSSSYWSNFAETRTSTSTSPF